ncbi:hypothetical protein Sjap_002413 [Stephania japonica]|uniref:Uncharacterized protein n=1 Tax=Stephania japonica TaxID=461633 RepID=A0AAP0KLV9_9MAGN
MEETEAIRRNFNAPAASIRRHQPLRRSFAYEAVVRSTNNSSMNEGSRQGNNNATFRFPIHLARPANQSFHRRNYYRPPYEVPPRNQNNHLRHYEVPPAAQQGNDMLLERMLEEEAREMRSGWTEEDIMKCLKTRSNDASLGNDQENTICAIYHVKN